MARTKIVCLSHKEDADGIGAASLIRQAFGGETKLVDYMDDRPVGSKLLQKFDRQFALLEATVLTFTIASHQKDGEYLLYLVDELSESKYPHDLPNAFEFARLQAEKISGVIQKVKENMKTMK